MVKNLIRRFARRYGYEILGPVHSYATHRTLSGLFRQEGINLVLDVGANAGQFASELLAGGYTERIISFEPLSAAHAKLSNYAKNHSNWTVADRTAIGAEKGSVEINVSGDSWNSSILGMLPFKAALSPQSAYVGTESVPLNRLDDLSNFSPNDRVFLKIDVQGYEKQVLEGAPRVLAACRGVQAEMSLLPLYEGQVLARDVWDFLISRGFEPWALEPGFRNPKSGRMQQVDGVFFRSGETS